MTFYKANRKLVSLTGYLKSQEGSVLESPIYLGIYDAKENYEEATKEDYEAYLKAEETKAEETNRNAI
jgi:hypothetical protein